MILVLTSRRKMRYTFSIRPNNCESAVSKGKARGRQLFLPQYSGLAWAPHLSCFLKSASPVKIDHSPDFSSRARTSYPGLKPCSSPQHPHSLKPTGLTRKSQSQRTQVLQCKIEEAGSHMLPENQLMYRASLDSSIVPPSIQIESLRS